MDQTPQSPQAGSYHYNIVRRAIEAIDAAGGAPLSLDDLAAQMQMSPTHFQRLFSKWAGVSPKKFQQYLTLNHAKSLIEANFTTLDTALSSGLSGAGRLHDLFVRWEAMSPGEFAQKGAGLTISYGWFDSPFGKALAMGTDRGLCGLAFAEETGDEAAMQDLRARWPNAAYQEAPEKIAPWANAALLSKGQTDLHLIGAPFQIKVWEALMHIPSGHVTTYSEIANAIGSPNANRAVGSAVGRNPIGWLIPCHRALRKSGGLGGYHWGPPVKRAMLAYEAARRDAPIAPAKDVETSAP
jgi:AraC family transcriptional regulator of adaptative response/methylated-DNA-[protein]-cysteine methyltransferase